MTSGGGWFSWRTLALVVAGGAVGVGLRAALVLAIPPGSHPIVVPAVTLAINLLGSFLLGWLAGAIGVRRPHLQSFLGPGVISGFTTYSAFAVQVIAVGGASPIVGLVLIGASLFGGALAAAGGLALGRRREAA